MFNLLIGNEGFTAREQKEKQKENTFFLTGGFRNFIAVVRAET